MTKFFRDFLRDDAGAAAAEYVLILAVVGAGIAGAAAYLGQVIGDGIDAKSKIIADCSTTPPGANCEAVTPD